MPTAPRRWIAAVAGLLVAVVTFAGHDTASSSHAGGDSSWTLYQSLSLLEDHDLVLTEWEDVLERYDFLWYRNPRGEPVTFFPWGTSLLVTPVVAALAGGEAMAGRSLKDELRTGFPLHETENTVSSLIVALTALGVFVLVFRENGSWPGAVFLALTFSFATSAFSSMSRALWSNGPAAFLITIELLIVQAADRSRRGQRLLVLLGPLFVLAYAVRPNTAVVALPLAVLVARRHPRWLPLVAVSTAMAGVGFVAANLAAFGEWQPLYYRTSRLFGSLTFLQALPGNWISPNRGILIWSPVLGFAGVGAVAALRRREFTGFQAVAVAGIFLHWIVIATVVSWTAGYSTGPRLFSDVLPLFILLMVPALPLLHVGSRVGRWATRTTWAVLLAFSLFTNWRGATRFETQLWNRDPPLTDARIWDWSDLQFLR